MFDGFFLNFWSLRNSSFFWIPLLLRFRKRETPTRFGRAVNQPNPPPFGCGTRHGLPSQLFPQHGNQGVIVVTLPQQKLHIGLNGKVPWVGTTWGSGQLKREDRCTFMSRSCVSKRQERDLPSVTKWWWWWGGGGIVDVFLKTTLRTATNVQLPLPGSPCPTKHKTNVSLLWRNLLRRCLDSSVLMNSLPKVSATRSAASMLLAFACTGHGRLGNRCWWSWVVRTVDWNFRWLFLFKDSNSILLMKEIRTSW